MSDLRPKIIWDYNSRPARTDELVGLVELALPDNSQMILSFNQTTGKLHIFHNDNWGYIDYEVVPA